MKPFDLAAALRGEPIQTKCGEPVKFLMYVAEANWPVLVLRDKETFTYTSAGRNGLGDQVLFMTSKKRTVYVDFFEDGSAEWYGGSIRTQHYDVKPIVRNVRVEIEV